MAPVASVVQWTEWCSGLRGSSVSPAAALQWSLCSRGVQWPQQFTGSSGTSGSMVSCSSGQWPRQFIGSVAPWFPVVSGGSLVPLFRLWCGAVAQVCSVWSSGSMDLSTPSNFVMLGMAQGNAPASSAAPISCKMVKWTQPLLGAASPPNSSSAVEPPTPWIKCSGTELHTNFRRPREVRQNGRPTTHGVVHGCALVCWRLMVQ